MSGVPTTPPNSTSDLDGSSSAYTPGVAPEARSHGAARSRRLPRTAAPRKDPTSSTFLDAANR